MKNFFFGSAFLLALTSYSAQANAPEKARSPTPMPSTRLTKTRVELDYNHRGDTITLGNLLFENRYDNKQIAIFGAEFLRFGWRMERLFHLDEFQERWGWRALLCWFDVKFETAYHETGHGLRARAFGHQYQLVPDKSVGGAFKKEERFFKFYVDKVLGAARATCRYDNKFTKESESTISPSKKYCIVFAGGINNNTYFAERICEDIYWHKDLYFMQGFSYLHNRLYLPIYALHARKKDKDPYDVALCWGSLGIPAKKKDMVSAGFLSFFLSGTTYYTFYAAGHALWGSGPDPTPPTICGFRVPDVFSYITSKGVSYRITSTYTILEGMDFHFGVERVMHGRTATEFHMGLRQTVAPWYSFSYGGMITFGEGVNLEGSVHIPIYDFLYINFSGVLYTDTSLLGERHSRNLRRDHTVCWFFSVSSRY
ncbi:MAG: hypothetical protein LBD66_02920 [Holosporales bacterium]|jgi:hypothetical protein|nr:hypothetical protein [Holosporales bacterium]